MPAVRLARRRRRTGDGCGTTWRSTHARCRRGRCSGGRERPADRGGIRVAATALHAPSSPPPSPPRGRDRHGDRLVHADGLHRARRDQLAHRQLGRPGHARCARREPGPLRGRVGDRGGAPAGQCSRGGELPERRRGAVGGGLGRRDAHLRPGLRLHLHGDAGGERDRSDQRRAAHRHRQRPRERAQRGGGERGALGHPLDGARRHLPRQRPGDERDLQGRRLLDRRQRPQLHGRRRAGTARRRSPASTLGRRTTSAASASRSRPSPRAS